MAGRRWSRGAASGTKSCMPRRTTARWSSATFSHVGRRPGGSPASKQGARQIPPCGEGGEGEKGGNMRMDTACISLETCMMLSEQSTPPCTWPKKNTVNNARGGHVWKLEGRRSSSGPTAAQGLPPRASLPPEDEVRQRPRFHERGSARREAGMRAVCYSVNAANKIKAATSRMSSLSSCGGLRVTGPVPRVSSPSSPPPSRSRSDRPSSPFSPSSPPPPLPGRRPLRAYVHAHAKMLRPSAVARSPAAGEGLSALPPPPFSLSYPAPPRPAPPRPARTVFGLIFGPYAEFSPTCGRFVHANGKLHSKAPPPHVCPILPQKALLENVQGRTNGYYCHCPARPTWPL